MDNAAQPRALIMRFLNYQEKQAVIRAAREKKDVFYKEQRVRFYPNLATGIHQLQKKFDPIREQLRKLGIRNGVTHPATLLVTYKNKTLAFKTPGEASEFLKKIQEGSGHAELLSKKWCIRWYVKYCMQITEIHYLTF